MASIFLDSQGVIMINYLEQCHTITDAYHAGELRRLRKGVARKRSGKLTGGALLLQDNTPEYTSQVAITVATECEILPHLPYSTYMAPTEYYLFPKLKSHLRGTQYGSKEGVTEAVKEHLGDQENVFYFEGIRKLEQNRTVQKFIMT